MNDSLVTSAKGRAAITSREGNILKAYDDGTGVLTIGVGHTSAAGDPKVAKGMTITAAQSDAILANDLRSVEKSLYRLVTVPLSQNQFDALVSFVFNVGEGNFAKSTMLKYLNAGDYDGAADQFGMWTKAGGKTMQGLVTRRTAERVQFLTKDTAPVPPQASPGLSNIPAEQQAPIDHVPVTPAASGNWIATLISAIANIFARKAV